MSIMVCIACRMRQKRESRAYARLNISLPRDTLALLDRVTTRGTRSRFIDDAIRDRAAALARSQLATRLAEGYAARSDRDLALAEDWLVLDEEVVWGRGKPRVPRRR